MNEKLSQVGVTNIQIKLIELGENLQAEASCPALFQDDAVILLQAAERIQTG